MPYIPYTTNSSKGAPVQNAFAQTFKDLGYPTTMKQAVTKTGELVWQKDEDGNLKPQMKRDRYGGADWVEKQKAVLQKMMLKKFGWERFYKGSNPRGNLTLSDYCREKAAEMAKEEERKLEDIKDKVTVGQVTIQAQAEQMEAILESLDKGVETELSVRITDKRNELLEQEKKLTLIMADADEMTERAQFVEELADCFRNLNSGEREKAYFEKMLEHFLRSIGEWVQQKAAGMSR